MGITLILLICLSLSVILLIAGVVGRNNSVTILSGIVFAVTMVVLGLVLMSIKGMDNGIEGNILQEDIGQEEDIKETEIEEDKLDYFYSEEVRKIYPFTGAFPSSWMVYLYKLDSDGLDNVKINGEFDDDFILKMAFSKVTKNDWYNSYTGEGELLYIKTEIFDQYVKDIFGDITYKKIDFDTKKLEIVDINDGLNINFEKLYTAKFNNENIEIQLSVPSSANFYAIETAYEKAVKYEDKIEITIKPYIIRYNMDDADSIDTVYARYNYNTKKFSEELTELASIKDIGTKNIKLPEEYVEKLDTFVFTYMLDNETGEYYFNNVSKR